MRFRINGFAAILVAITVIVAGAAFMTSRLYGGLTDDVEQSQFKTMQAIVQTALSDAENKALARAELIADLPKVQTLFAAGDRTALEQELAEMFATQKARHGVDQAQFHVAPATSFLRLHDPATFGDDLTVFRPMVVAALRDHVPMKGIAIARKGPAIFGISPVDDASGKPIGTFEIGLDFGPLLTSLKNAYDMDFALFIDEKPLRDFANGADPERLGDQNRVGRYMRFESTNTARMAALVGPDELAVVNEPVTLVRDFNGIVNGVLLVPLNNAGGTPVGVMAVAADFSASRAAVSRSQIWQAVITLIAIVLLAGFVIVLLRGYILRPLTVINSRFNDVLTNQPLSPIEGSERFPAELQGLVRVYQRIFSRRTAPDSQA